MEYSINDNVHLQSWFERIDHLLKRDNKQRVPIPGDGHCLVRSLFHGANIVRRGKYESYEGLFLSGIDFFSEHAEHYVDRLPTETYSLQSCIQDLNRYFMERAYTERDLPSEAIDVFINVISDMTKLQIYVYSLDDTNNLSSIRIEPTLPGMEIAGCIELVHCPINLHYDAVRYCQPTAIVKKELVDLTVKEEHAPDFNTMEATELYANDPALPIFRRGDALVIQNLPALKIILAAKKNLASDRPVFVQHNVMFLIDTKKMKNWMDLRSDTAFMRTKTKVPVYFDTSFKKSTEETAAFSVERITYYHKKSKDFHKVLIFVTRHSDDVKVMLPTVLVQYYFDQDEHPVEYSSSQSRALPSMVESLTYSGDTRSAKETFHSTLNEVGGFEHARTVEDLPRSFQLIYDVNRRNDELLEVMDMSISHGHVMRSVRVRPEVSIFCGTDAVLHDVWRFCANNYPFCVFGVDPTFNITKSYNVTLTTYRHKLLLTENNVHPVFLGPALIHVSKKKNVYDILGAEAIRLNPSLRNLLALGTDDEETLYDGLLNSFIKAKHLLCGIHVQGAIERAADDHNVDCTQLVKDVLGQNGLVDCITEEEFDQRYNDARQIWLGREGPDFVSYMDTNKRDKIKKKMLASVRTACGLGSPPARFTTNPNESMNNKIKEMKVGIYGSRELTLKETVQLLKTAYERQEEQAKLALVGQSKRSNLHLVPSLQSQLGMTDEEYYHSNAMQRTAKFGQFQKYVPPAPFQEVIAIAQEEDQEVSLPQLTFVPDTIKSEIENDIRKVKVTPFDGAPLYFVTNLANRNSPYQVTYDGSKCSFTCTTRENKPCQRFKPYKICAQVGAVAKSIKCLDNYLTKLVSTKNKRKQIVSAVATSDRAPGAGKKPKTVRKSRKPPTRKGGLVSLPPTAFPVRRFSVKFVGGNIRACHACPTKPIVNPPTDEIEQMCLVYRDNRFHYGNDVLKNKNNAFTAVHFHLDSECVKKKYPNFQPSQVFVPEIVKDALSATQRAHLRNIFPNMVLQ